ncbi:iron-sulfur cluster carrier protein ApbC [Legionella hackeliae]|uniref:Iron-sulfur cluster carrier protein n=1 Tax=Legionella hackeliae TaxID=449 RepID=A0A0A8UX24_LEGHA|nr:iron-sulfur cluster carrier protein ApbC [Legionella hackeliae]KTD15324.1 ATPase [Legionella hackeliae]CEK11309.1 putative ATPase [Legionella hackeliae]STX48079.1 chromosome partitioning ATP-binding protein [Legionella hackeliae]
MKFENTITELLNTVKDKSLNLTPQQMGLKPVITADGNCIDITLHAGFPTLPLEESLLPPLRERLQQALPDYQITITFNFFIKAHRTQLPGKGLKGAKNLIAIASGKGGVGKSTVAINLAIALARSGAKVGILDADIYGPSIPLMLGNTKSVEVSDDHYLPITAHGVQAMSIGYLTNSQEALIWRGPMLAKSLIQMLDITRWDELDYLLIDLPPGTGDIQLSLVQKIPLAGAVVVTTPQNVATLDAQKAIKMFARTNIDVLGLVENMSLHVCSQCGHQEAIFGHGGGEILSQTFTIPLLGQLPLDKRIQMQCDEGNPTATRNDELAKIFMNTALQTAIALAKKPLNYADRFGEIVVE